MFYSMCCFDVVILVALFAQRTLLVFGSVFRSGQVATIRYVDGEEWDEDLSAVPFLVLDRKPVTNEQPRLAPGDQLMVFLDIGDESGYLATVSSQVSGSRYAGSPA